MVYLGQFTFTSYYVGLFIFTSYHMQGYFSLQGVFAVVDFYNVHSF